MVSRIDTELDAFYRGIHPRSTYRQPTAEASKKKSAKERKRERESEYERKVNEEIEKYLSRELSSPFVV